MRDKTVIKWLVDGKIVEEEWDHASDESINIKSESVEQVIEEEEDLPINTVSNHMIQLCLHEFLEKISILKCISQKNSKPCHFKFPVYETIEQRFGDIIDYGSEFYSEDKKRYSDLTTIYSLIYRALEDLTNYGHFNSLIQGTRILKKLREDEEQLISDEENSLKVETELNQNLVTQVKILENRNNDKLEELRKLELEYEDTIGYGSLEFKYVEAWEASRQHQNKLVIKKEEFNYTDIVNTCEIKTNLENRVHSEIVRYCEENSEDMQNEIQYWMERYEEDIESRDAEILKLKMERDDQMEKYLKLKTSYEDRRDFIEYWAGILEERRIAEELLAMQTAAAIKIQAWWRMVMVLRKLGPFRKKKGKGKDKKGAKGKKKK